MVLLDVFCHVYGAHISTASFQLKKTYSIGQNIITSHFFTEANERKGKNVNDNNKKKTFDIFGGFTKLVSQKWRTIWC